MEDKYEFKIDGYTNRGYFSYVDDTIIEVYIDDNGDEIKISSDNTSIIYSKNDLLHRVGGPAVLYDTDSGIHTEYYQNDILHREDGPAFNWLSEISPSWWYRGKEIFCNNQEEFDRIINLILFT